ncbi:MAG: mechanosensitive ion channel domain-containing protein [Candidatus Thorarchaeota archaeon]
MIIAISLNFRKIINNIASGGLLLMSEQFDIGDLIETNNAQGIVKEINLNYVKIREFDGVDLVLPNSNVYGSTIIKFTHSKFKVFEPIPRKEFEKKRYYRRYLKTISKLLSAKIKTTKYVKQLEIRGSVDPEKLDEYLFKVFDIYEPIFGKRPDYSVDTTLFGRVRINFYIISEKPNLVLNYIDAFLRDLVYELYSDEIYLEWEEYKQDDLNEIDYEKKEGNS